MMVITQEQHWHQIVLACSMSSGAGMADVSTRIECATKITTVEMKAMSAVQVVEVISHEALRLK